MDLIHEISGRLQEVNESSSRQYANLAEDLRLVTGDCWTDSALKARENKPILTINYAHSLKNRIVNPIRKNPFGIEVNAKDEKLGELFQGLVREIEYKSNASEAYETAFDTAVSGGIGFIDIETDYEDEESPNQTVRINTNADPLSCFLDPNSKNIDGSDAMYGFKINYIAEDKAEREYKLKESEEHYFNVEALYKHWQIPNKTVPELIYYKVDCKKLKRTWLKNGESIDGPIDEEIPEDFILNSREIEKKSVIAYKFVGGKKVYETKLEIPFIPIVPVYGDRIFEGDWVGYAGIAKLVKDSQRMACFYASAEAQLIESSPVSPWIAEEGQIEGYENDWANANNAPTDTLVYKGSNVGGKPTPPPSRVDNSAQTSHLIQARELCVQDMQRVTGVFDAQLGNNDQSQQSGRAVLLNNINSDVSTAHYTDNLGKSIAQVGRVVVALILSTYDTERELSLRGASGKVKTESLDISSLNIKLSELDIRVGAGPMFENSKQAHIAQFTEIAQSFPQVLDETMIAGFKKLLPSEFQEQEEQGLDPEAMQAINEAQTTVQTLEEQISQYEAIIQNLQTQIISDAEDRKAKIQTDTLKAETDLAIAEMNNANKLELEAMKQEGKEESDNKKILNEQMKRIEDREEKALEKEDKIIEQAFNEGQAMQQVEKVGGPIT